MTPRAVLFDLDGTLIDSLADIGNAMNVALAALGFPLHSLDDYRRFIGRGLEQLIAAALPPAPEGHSGDGQAAGHRAEVFARFRAEYGQNLAVQTRLYPEVDALLDALSDRGVPMAILSNKPDDSTQRLARLLLGSWRFCDVRGERSGTPRKPDPAAALDIARRAEIIPEDWVLLGDSGVDVATARAAGMRPFGASWGFRGAPELAEAGAERILDSPLALLSAFESQGFLL